jgi:long-chain acyl-CoA synthetase
MGYSYDTDALGDIAPRSAALFGDAPALAMSIGEAISYNDLDRLSLRTAVALARLGIAKGDRVALISENRPEWGIASLGIARAGAVAVPILIDFTAEQIGNILAHSGSRAAFVSARLKRKLETAPPRGEVPRGEGPRLLAIEELSKDESAERGADLAPPSPLPRAESGDLAAIVYTSGTTGLSKGVMLTHRNFIADALACDSVIRLDGQDLLLSILPLAHSYEYTIGFLIPMMSGACVRYLERPPSASALLPALASLRPTIMLSVPMVIEKVYRSSVEPALGKIALCKIPPLRPVFEWLAGLKLKKTFGGRLRFFGIGGAPLDPDVERFLLHARFPYAIGYGLTETAPIIAAAAVGKTKVKVAGPPLAGADIRIAGSADSSPGAMGEIQVRGPMVGPGYYRDAARTAEAFTQDGYFRTGDLGSFDSRRRLSVRGRLKTVILGASGENIYPEEVEAVINASPYVAESLVYDDDAGLAALIQLKPEVLEELSAYVKEGEGGAEKAAGRFGQAVGSAIRWATQEVSAAGRAADEAISSAELYIEEAAAPLLERVKKETNCRLAAFSRLASVELQAEPFEKTPTQKIKRFLYPKK